MTALVWLDDEDTAPLVGIVQPQPIHDPVLPPHMAELVDLTPPISCTACHLPLSDYLGHWCLTARGETWREHIPPAHNGRAAA